MHSHLLLSRLLLSSSRTQIFFMGRTIHGARQAIAEEWKWIPQVFDAYSSVKDDQRGRSNFNWRVGSSNYQVLRTGCYPYIKYHCSRRQEEDLRLSDKLMWCVKTFNLGIPCLLYGLAAINFITHEETVHTPRGPVSIYFLLPEHKGSLV